MSVLVYKTTYSSIKHLLCHFFFFEKIYYLDNWEEGDAKNSLVSIIFPPLLGVKLKRGCVGEFRKVYRSRNGYWKYIGKSRTTTKKQKQKIHSIRANENKYVVKLICQPKIWG